VVAAAGRTAGADPAELEEIVVGEKKKHLPAFVDGQLVYVDRF
jgi:hypothetical protein